MASCSDQLSENEYTGVEKAANLVSNEYQHYLEKARWGDADTYVKLADCYRNGVDVKADFMGMTAMLAMAEQY